MKRIVLVIGLVLLAGCSGLPFSGDSSPTTETQSSENVTVTQLNETQDADYQIGTLPNSSVESHPLFIINKRGFGNVTVTVYPTDAPETSLNQTLEPGDMLEVALQHPSEYTIEVSDPVDDQVTIDSTEFGCEFTLHNVDITDSGIDTSSEKNSQSC